MTDDKQRPTTGKPVLMLHNDVAAILHRFPNGHEIVVVGLTEENLKQMRDGAYIHLLGEEMGLGNKPELIIVVGNDKAAVMDLLKGTTRKPEEITDATPRSRTMQ